MSISILVWSKVFGWQLKNVSELYEKKSLATSVCMQMHALLLLRPKRYPFTLKSDSVYLVLILQDTLHAPPAKEIKLEDHCQYRFDIHTHACSFWNAFFFICFQKLRVTIQKWSLVFYCGRIKTGSSEKAGGLFKHILRTIGENVVSKSMYYCSINQSIFI